VTIGEQVLWRDKPYTLLGIEPMGIPARQADLLDAVTCQRLHVPVDELEALPPRTGPPPPQVLEHPDPSRTA
jgi:hypothetical protein